MNAVRRNAIDHARLPRSVATQFNADLNAISVDGTTMSEQLVK